MQTTEPLTINDIADHAYWLDGEGDWKDDRCCRRDWERVESAELTERFIDTFGEQDNQETKQ